MGQPIFPEHPPFAEALPRFNILTLDKAMRAGAVLLYWYDQNGGFVGAAHVIGFGRDHLELAVSFEGDEAVDPSIDNPEFQLTRSSPGKADNRPSIVCPECERGRVVMIADGLSWACRQCHGLLNFSAVIDAQTRKHLRLRDLSRVAEHPRHRYMHHRKYDDILREYEQLSNLLAGEAPRTLRAEYQHHVHERYFRPGEAPMPNEPEPPHAQSWRSRRI